MHIGVCGGVVVAILFIGCCSTPYSLTAASFVDQDNRGFCLVDDSAENGISPVSRDAVARNLPIPEIFPGLDMYLEASRQTTSDAVSVDLSAMC